MRIRNLVMCLLSVSLLFITSQAAFAVAPYQFDFLWPQPWSVTNPLTNPVAAATDSSGNLYVADAENNQILKISRDGSLISTWGPAASGSFAFSAPSGVTVDNGGNVYVADTNNNRIREFDANGNLLNTYGPQSGVSGQLSGPCGVAVDSSGNVYVADTFNSRIAVFNNSGIYQTQLGTSGAGTLSLPFGVAVDSVGNIYVADTFNADIKKFSANGTLLTTYGLAGSSPYGVAVDSNFNVYLVDIFKNDVQVYSESGQLLTTYYGTGMGQFPFASPQGLAVDVSDNVYVADSGNARIQKLTFSTSSNSFGSVATVLGSVGVSGTPSDFNPSGVAVDATGNVYVADSINNSILEYSSNGTYITTLGTAVQFSSPSGVAVNTSTGNLYVADTDNSIIQVGSFNGTSGLWTWTSFNGYNGTNSFSYPGAVAVNSSTGQTYSGYIYVADTDNNEVKSFNSSGAYQSTFTTGGTFIYPNGVAVNNSTGNVYVTDSGNNRIVEFSGSGSYITQWGTLGSGNNQFSAPSGVSVDSTGYVYVVDSGNNRVSKFTSTGTFISTWGTAGSGAGQFNLPVLPSGVSSGVAVDSSGNVYVTDANNSRMQKFYPGKANPNITVWPATNNPIISGSTLVSAGLTNPTEPVSGNFTFTTPSTVPPVGTYNAAVTFTPADTTDYNTVSLTVPVTVQQASSKITPTITWPTSLGIIYGQTLSNIDLSGGSASTLIGGIVTAVPGTFAFTTLSTPSTVGNYSASVTFTPNNAAAYNSVSGIVTVAVGQATPTISNLPVAGGPNYGYGMQLSQCPLTGGSASALIGGVATPVQGTFTFSFPNTTPLVVGNYSAAVTFTPTDTVDYTSLSTTVTVPVTITSVRILRGSTVIGYYSSITNAYSAPPIDGDIIELQGTAAFNENLVLNSNIDISIIGGFDTYYTVSTGTSTLIGTITVEQGSLSVQKVAVQAAQGN